MTVEASRKGGLGRLFLFAFGTSTPPKACLHVLGDL
jgi:hypothetical protein